MWVSIQPRPSAASCGIKLSVKDRQAMNVPVWADIGALVIGAAPLVFAGNGAEQRLGPRTRHSRELPS